MTGSPPVGTPAEPLLAASPEGRAARQAAADRGGERWVSPLALAVMDLSLGDKPAAYTGLQRARDSQDFYLSVLRGEPALDGFRGDASFESVVRDVGL